MSLKYAKDNEESIKDLFEKRRYYINDSTSNYKNLTNFDFAEKYLYGRVDRDYVPVILNEERVSLRQARTKSNTQKITMGPSFVLDAFDALALQFEKARIAGQIKADDKFLASLKIVNSYQPPNKAYMDYFNKFAEGLRNEVGRRKTIIKTFDDFAEELLVLVEKAASRFPFTYTGFVKSRFCSPMISGLVLEIAAEDHSNDEKKIENFIHSPNWHFFLNACANYGFLVDQNRPWRLVADIGSDEMLRYSRNYALESTDEIISSAFNKTHLKYYGAFKVLMLELYNKVKKPRYNISEYCNSTGKDIPQLVHSDNYTIDTLNKTYSDKYFLNMYCKIRLMEESENLMMNETQKRKLIKKTIDRIGLAPDPRVLTDFEKIINEPYNSSGSLTRVNLSVMMRQHHAEQNIDEGEIEKVFSGY